MNELLSFMNLFAEFRAPSWNPWRNVLARITPNVREFYGIKGRGAGGSRVVALIASFKGTRSYRRVPGENIFVGIFAPDRKQAGVTFRYVIGLLRSVPELSSLIVAERADSVELLNGVVIEVITASIAAPRGRAYALVIIEEAAFLPTDHSANPDKELIRAVRPALARVPGSLLCVISSPYARKGVLWDAWRRHHGKPDGEVVLVQAGTLELNPTFDRRAIDRAREDDPAAALAEFDAEFRSDVESFISRDVLDAAVTLGRHELAPTKGTTYTAFVDPSGGSADAFTLAIAHRQSDSTVLDLVRETRPPFSPESTVADYASVLEVYGIGQVVGDRYAGEWPREQFRKHRIEYVVADRAKSDIYRDVLPLLNSGRVELLDHPRLLGQLAGLERRTARGGRDSIDHGPGGHDDVANAAAGALVYASASRDDRSDIAILQMNDGLRRASPWSGREDTEPAGTWPVFRDDY